MGDIHGRLDLLERLLALIAEDAAGSAAPHRHLVFLGDLIDRGPDSRGVVETLRRGPPASPQWCDFRWTVLMGNHEDEMLRFLVDPEGGEDWMANGGLETIRSYAGSEIRRGSLEGLRRALLHALPESHRAFLAGLPLSCTVGDYMMVHAGIRPQVPLDRQARADLLWIRGPFLASDEAHGKMVVHGHTIVTEPEDRANRIAIDTGAYFSGRLTALVAEGDEHGFLST